MGKEAITKKIKGEFLRIEKEGSGYRLNFIDEKGNVASYQLSVDYPSQYGKIAETKFRALMLEPLNKKDVNQVFARRVQLLQYQVEALWPQIYISHCKGEGVDQYFQSPATQPKQQTKTERGYAPNLKYQDFHYERFSELWIQKNSQKVAYDELVTEFPRDIDPDGFDGFIVQFRKWNKRTYKERK